MATVTRPREDSYYTHRWARVTIGKTMDSVWFLYTLVGLLDEKELLTVEELDERKMVVGKRLADEFRQNGDGVMLQDPEYDKYSFQEEVELDCASRVHLCRAACCRLPFALSKQDIREGIVHWELGQPYLIARNGNGICDHLDATTTCAVWANRPVPCRAFDCRKDKRIWLDFEQMVLNPAVTQPDWPYCLAEENEQGSRS